MKRICVDVDEELFKRFSKKCIDVGKTKMDVLRELIRKWVEENEKNQYVHS